MNPIIPCCLLSVVLISAQLANAADFAEELKAKQQTGGAQEIQEFIEKSYDAHKTDPAYFVASANVLWKLAAEPNISTKPAEPGDYALVDPKTGKPAGSLSTSGRVNPALQKKAAALLDEAYREFPHRLDIGMGLAHLLRQMNESSQCCGALIQVLTNARKQGDKLQWKDGGPLPEPAAEYIPSLMQSYAAGFFNLETKEGDTLCRRLCEKVVETYPDSPYAYNMLAALSDANGDRKAAIKYLLAALAKAPKDTIVIFNLADMYRADGDKANALKYYKQVLALKPDAEMKKSAQAAVAELGK